MWTRGATPPLGWTHAQGGDLAPWMTSKASGRTLDVQSLGGVGARPHGGMEGVRGTKLEPSAASFLRQAAASRTATVWSLVVAASWGLLEKAALWAPGIGEPMCPEGIRTGKGKPPQLLLTEFKHGACFYNYVPSSPLN